jgi:hypothetical protein
MPQIAQSATPPTAPAIAKLFPTPSQCCSAPPPPPVLLPPKPPPVISVKLVELSAADAPDNFAIMAKATNPIAFIIRLKPIFSFLIFS